MTDIEYKFDSPWYPINEKGKDFRIAAKTLFLTYLDYRGTLIEL